MNKNDWIQTNLANVCEQIVGGGTPSTKIAEYWQGDIPWISSADILSISQIIPRKAISESAINNSATNLVRRGDILVVTRVGLGKVAIAPFDLCFSQDVQGIILKNDIIDQSYALLFISDAMQRLKFEGRGTTINGITKKQLYNLNILFPSLPEQRAIVAKIEQLFSDLDNGIANLKQAREQLKVYRQAVLKKAFEGELTKEWRKKQGENFNSWQEITFAQITESLKRGPFGGDLKKSFFVDKGYAVYEQQHAIKNDFSTIRYYINNERFELLKACNVEPGDYIVSCSGTMGKIAQLPDNAPVGVINQALLRIRIDENIIIHRYFIEFFRSHIFQRKILKNSRGSGMQNMAGVKEIKPIPIVLPSKEEQQQIVSEIESRLSVCDNVEANIEAALQQSEALRQSILKKAFEGELLTESELAACRAEPDWEPAEKLLQCIKFEREGK